MFLPPNQNFPINRMRGPLLTLFGHNLGPTLRDRWTVSPRGIFYAAKMIKSRDCLRQIIRQMPASSSHVIHRLQKFPTVATLQITILPLDKIFIITQSQCSWTLTWETNVKTTFLKSRWQLGDSEVVRLFQENGGWLWLLWLLLSRWYYYYYF